MRRSMIVMFLLTSVVLQGCTTKPEESTGAVTTGSTAATTTEETTTLEVTVRDTTAAMTSYKAGTYTASAKGYGGDVTVTVTVDENKITAVSAEGPDETEGIGSKALAELPDLILSEQNSDVDVIAGATVTSKGITDALKIALEQAGKAGNE